MIRFLGSAVVALIAAAVIGLIAPGQASATSVSDVRTPPPSPLTVFVTPVTVGLHVIEAIAEGIANAVEIIAMPEPIAIPAPQNSA